MVVVEERGNPAGLRQAPRERRRRERGRAAPKGDFLVCVWQPKPQVYIGGKGAAPPLGFPTPRGVASPRWDLEGAAKRGREGARPRVGL